MATVLGIAVPSVTSLVSLMYGNGVVVTKEYAGKRADHPCLLFDGANRLYGIVDRATNRCNSNNILKGIDDFGFLGFVLSGFLTQHSTTGAMIGWDTSTPGDIISDSGPIVLC